MPLFVLRPLQRSSSVAEIFGSVGVPANRARPLVMLGDASIGTVQSVLSAVEDDLSAGNFPRAQADLKTAQGYVNGISDPASRANAQALVDRESARVAALSPAQAASNARNFQTTDATLTRNAQTLDSDQLYVDSQGNLTSSPDAAAANKASGGSNNFLNPQSFGGGISNWFSRGGLNAVFNASLTGDQNKAPSLGNFFTSPTGLLVAAGAALVLVGGGVSATVRRRNPRRGKRRRGSRRRG